VEDAGEAEGGSEAGGGDSAAAANSVSGTYGTDAVKPVETAYWIGQPSNPAESGGGPFIYLFSGPITCSALSQGSGWLTTIAAGTQVTELIVGTTSVGTPVSAASHAAPNVVEANYAYGGSSNETRATSGTVTLTSYSKGLAVDGTLDLTFPVGSAKGTFHATWCATGNEL
jgi:hypothetical protein